MSVTTQAISELITPTITQLGFELYGCELVVQQQRCILRVYVDSPQGVNADDCAKISRDISMLLNVEEPIKGRYTLEVSSPGVDRRLFSPAHYQRAIGARIKFQLVRPRAGQRNFSGTIKLVANTQVTIELTQGELIEADLSEISKANLIGDF